MEERDGSSVFFFFGWGMGGGGGGEEEHGTESENGWPWTHCILFQFTAI